MNIAILTPLAIELNAVLMHLNKTKTITQHGYSYHHGKFVGKHHSFNICIKQTGAGNSNIALATEKIIQLFQPSIIFLTGIAGKVKDVNIGDVVVANKSYEYESGKETEDGYKARPESIYYSPDLFDLAQIINRQSAWQNRSPNAKTAQVYFGAIASGNKVIASTNSVVYQRIKNHFNDTLALEMEAAGFSKALLYHPLIKAINIRGISDSLDNKSKTDAEGNQELAVANATAFLFEMLYQLDFSKLTIPEEITKVKTFVKDLYQQVLPQIQKEAGLNIAVSKNPFHSEILNKIKSLLKHEYQEVIADYQDEDTHAFFRNQLKKLLAQNSQLKNELYALLKKSKQGKTKNNLNIKNSKNVISGTEIKVKGDFQLGDRM